MRSYGWQKQLQSHLLDTQGSRRVFKCKNGIGNYYICEINGIKGKGSAIITKPGISWSIFRVANEERLIWSMTALILRGSIETAWKLDGWPPIERLGVVCRVGEGCRSLWAPRRGVNMSGRIPLCWLNGSINDSTACIDQSSTKTNKTQSLRQQSKVLRVVISIYLRWLVMLRSLIFGHNIWTTWRWNIYPFYPWKIVMEMTKTVSAWITIFGHQMWMECLSRWRKWWFFSFWYYFLWITCLCCWR